MTLQDSRHPGPRRRAVAGVAAAAVVVSGIALAPGAGAAPNSDVGLPVFSGSDHPVPDQGTGFHPQGQLRAIFDADVAAGAGTDTDHDFWVDRMLARTGTAPGGSNGDGNQWLFSRGRAVFMKTHDPAKLGFGGEVAYWESIAGGQGAYTLDVLVDGEPLTLTEVRAERKQTPSYWRSTFTDGAGGLRVVQTKYITHDNVAVTQLAVSAADGTAHDVTLRATSSFATQADGDELTGSVRAFNDITTVFPRFSGDGFVPDDGALSRAVEVPAEGAVTTKVQLGFVTHELPGSLAEYEEFRDLDPAAAYTEHVTAYNAWWADNIPFLDTPEDNIDKTLFYRWWLMRFNFLDADVPGNDYQFPTTMEGVLGYNNAIDLTIGMFLDDLKYLRDPAWSYGTWVSAGETAGAQGQYRDNPGDPANWSASHTQYISESAWQSYQIHGGPSSVAKTLGTYAERDTAGELATLDTNDNFLLDTNWNAWTGNDADAVSFDWADGRLDRAETAYVYSGAMAGAEALDVAGETDRADALRDTAQDVKDAVLDVLWDPEDDLLLHAVASTGEQVPWKEINNYYPYSVGLMPKPGDADYDDDYVEALRLFADDDEFPIFPFFTANQADKAEAAAAGNPGSNNFSVINSTVTFRMLSSVLRDYPTDYVTADWYKKLLYWNAWSHYQDDGDNRYPDQNEFWADGSADPQGIGYRSWIHHTMLGTTNWTVVEDAMGLRPRTDAKIELDPIDIDWDHFAATDLSYRDKDLAITWDAPGGERYYGDDVPEGYSVFLDGELAFTADQLSHVVYDPATGDVQVDDGVQVSDAAALGLAEATDVHFAAGSRVADVLAKAGTPATDADHDAVDVAAGKPVAASFAANGRAAAQAVDGRTAMESFWGTAGSPNATDSVTVDLADGGDAVPVDDVRVYFYRASSSATAQGYAAPSQYLVEYDDGSGWQPVPDQARTPAYPRGNLNHVQFPQVEAERLRVTVQHAAGARTGIKEVQAFATGASAPEPTDVGPHADAWVDSGSNQAGAARLVGLAQGDGSSSDAVSARWSVVDAPEGGSVLFDDESAATTIARFGVTGRYTLRLTATEGDATATADVVVDATALAEGEIDLAPGATPTASYTAGWNDVDAVNDGKDPFFSGGNQTDLWGTWTGSEPATRWLQYTFDEPVRVDRTSIDFWYDSTSGGSGVSVPQGWHLQYWDAAAGDGEGGWADVPDPSAFGTERDATNEVTFGAVTTTRLRATFDALAGGGRYSAVGVSEWRVFAAAAASVDPVDVRTTVGELPELPATVDVVYPDGARLATPVTWGAVTAQDVAQEGDVSVVGVLGTTSLTAQATVWVRAQLASTVTTVDPVEVSTFVGVVPVLPTTVTVQYNDGTRASGTDVVWDDVDPADFAAEGTFDVGGTVAGSQIRARATVVVGSGGEPDPELDLAVEVSPRCLAGKAYVAVRATNGEDVPVDVTLSTPFGEKSFDGVAPGKNAYQSFAARAVTVPAGEAAVTASGTVGGEQVTTTLSAPYDALDCS
ncbi:Ig-like domain-containing protein [Cellulosimicrobium arenosum]|uniref:Ig-like domain-containing protein n=1 Tax=Cellulosimicrobium arenosum TaxID=2708133 RepID=A0A927PFJ1_9MICO|nr:Ig-like domain-containing protein [Cellulosimicrobium arenosum]MBD8080027.1 Ig-like domain-containing protein [Cellulosimicrobium arenosum]